jgi:hypothetical protein
MSAANSNGGDLPTLPNDPYGEKLDLHGCRRPVHPLSDSEVDASAEVWRLITRLESEAGYRVMHGSWETLICYREFRIGGIDRQSGHCFVYETLTTHVVAEWLRALGFKLTLMGRRPGTAYAGHKWYQVPLSDSSIFEHALRGIAAAIDLQVGSS